MRVEMVVISEPNPQWSNFVNGVVRLTGNSPTRILDANNITVGLPTAFAAALQESVSPGTNPSQLWKIDDRTLRHLYFGFLVSCDHNILVNLLEYCNRLSVTLLAPGRNCENFLMTSSLDIWKYEVLRFCSAPATLEMRTFFNTVWECFNQRGFRELFGARRVDMPDRTFALEFKR